MRPFEVNQAVLADRDAYLDSFKGKDFRELFLACRDDPAVFAKYVLGVRV